MTEFNGDIKVTRNLDQIERFSTISSKATEAPAGREIIGACLDTAALLINKNISYGNSALEPIQVFAKGGPVSQLENRIDDKLTRVRNSQGYPGDNDIDDLIGYLVLLKIAKANAMIDSVEEKSSFYR